MYYFKYDEKYTNSNRSTLDIGNYKNEVNSYLYRTDPTTGVNTYIVEVDLEENEIQSFLKLQKVELISITREEFVLYSQTSNEYLMYRSIRKETKTNESDVSIVTYKGINYDADEKSMYRMSRLINLYNFKFNRLLAAGNITPSKAYEIFKEKIEWIDADNLYQDLTIEEVGFILQLAIGKFERLWKQ